MTNTVTDSELAAVKLYMRIDGSDEDDDIELLYLAARQYLAAAGVPVPDGMPDAQYVMLVHGLTLWYHDQKDGTSAKPTGLRQAITQRKLCGAL